MEISPENIPMWMQIATGIGMACAIGVISVMNYFRKKFAPEKGEHIVLEQAALADMRPMRDALKTLDRLVSANERIANAAERIEEIVRESANEEEIERRAKALAAEMQREHDRKRP